MKEITKRWHSAGLLDNLNPVQMEVCAGTLDAVARQILKDCPPETEIEKYRQYDDFVAFIIPMVRRIFDRIYPEPFPAVQWFVKDCFVYFCKNKHLYDELTKTHEGVDGEAEMAGMYETYFMNRREDERKTNI